MSMTNVRRGERILDAGCGAGHYTQALLAAGAEAHALDALPRMIESVRSRLGVHALVGDLTTIVLEPVYDKIVCAGVLEFVPERAAALTNLARGLRPEGPRRITLLILARCLPGVGYWLARRCNGISMPMYTRRGLAALADAAGLRVVEARRAGYNWVAALEPRGTTVL
jgi:SAM-dependent methyltransferase